MDVLLNNAILQTDLDSISDSFVTAFDMWVDNLTDDRHVEYNSI
jgi:hypothetical protein